ncbi:unnamed protein product [Phytomonas sp. EM1]|nr:unnamed protein product [Phytomonas sp. EM1]|eukprot:CCW62893.1 unnamed protein product [Phytomonas sp. isolate EM1]
MVGVLHVVGFLYEDRPAREATARLYAHLLAHYRFEMLGDVVGMLRDAAVHAGGPDPGGSEPPKPPPPSPSRDPLGRAFSLDAEADGMDAVVAHLLEPGARREGEEGWPILDGDPRLQCRVLSGVFAVLPRCEAALAERLGRVAFHFLRPPPANGGFAAPYGVRKHAALAIRALFRRFHAAAGAVLHELLFRCREGILSKNQLGCATSLLALAEAGEAAPAVEARVVYTLLECYATRGFAFRPMVLECLERLAGCPPFSRTSLMAMGDVRSGDAAYARLCAHHIETLLFWWIYRDRHPVEALPAECFGFSTVEDVVRANLPHFVPLATLLEGGGNPVAREIAKKMRSRIGKRRGVLPLRLSRYSSGVRGCFTRRFDLC